MLVTNPQTREIFGDPTPLAMLGLAVGCAALAPIAFGHSLTPAGFCTAAWFCLLFGFGGQLVAGLMAFANRNSAGGTLLTAFSFNWLMNYHVLDSLSKGVAPDHAVLLAVDCAFLVVFVMMTYACGLVSGSLFVLMAVIDVLYACKVGKGLLGGTAFDVPIAIATVALGVVALWIAFGLLINPLAGRKVVPSLGPMFKAGTV